MDFTQNVLFRTLPYLKKVFKTKLSAVTLCLLFFLSSPAIGQEKEALQELLQTIEQSAEFDALKTERIRNLKTTLRSNTDQSLENLYILNSELFDEYRIFKQDSAFKYALISQEIAEEMGSTALMAETTLDLANLCVSAGMFREAMEYFEIIDPEEIPEELRFVYYSLLGRCYTDMAEYSSIYYFSSRYEEMVEELHIKALSLIESGTWDHTMLKGYMSYRANELDESLEILLPLLETSEDLRVRAVTHSVIGDVYTKMGDSEKAIYHLSKASIADIKSSAKENLAIIRLAELLFKEGEVKLASAFIKKAGQDAEDYGAQQRKIRVGAILPLIEEQVVEQVENQRKRLYEQNIMLSILLLFVVVLAIITWLQLRKLKRARRAVIAAHNDLQIKNEEIILVNEEINNKNEQLNALNNKLLEANKIKEEYIGFFFSQDADIFEKFRDFKSRIQKDLKKNNIDGVKYFVNAYDLKGEKEKLLQSFDEAFIKLFPNFIEEFNSLLQEGEKIELKDGQILNKELRIFALIRLGITHNEIIAQILGYSVNSIYAYKTKIRKKSLLNKKDFDQMLLENTLLKL